VTPSGSMKLRTTANSASRTPTILGGMDFGHRTLETRYAAPSGANCPPVGDGNRASAHHERIRYADASNDNGPFA
jgi:hypothetical protein